MTQHTNYFNVLRQAAKPNRLPVMLEKVMRRCKGAFGERDNEQNLSWISSITNDYAAIANSLNSKYWHESLQYGQQEALRADQVLSQLEVGMGGGAIYPLLYFLVRLQKPQVVVETGVAAGFSSRAILAAMRENGVGTLYSSDFPYVRIPNSERYIGILVEPELRSRWRVYLDGDKKNLKKILSQITAIDIFHYDSDKSYGGRRMAVQMVKERMSPRGILMMDDIQDNSFFHDYTIAQKPRHLNVFRFQNKYIGTIGDFSPPPRRDDGDCVSDG